MYSGRKGNLKVGKKDKRGKERKVTGYILMNTSKKEKKEIST